MNLKRINIKIVYFALLLVIIINIILIYQSKAEKKLYSILKSNYNNVIHDCNFLYERLFENLERKPLESVFTDSELIHLKRKPRHNIFVWRYFENSCSSCLDQEIINLKKYSPMIGSENILVLTTFYNLRDLNVSFTSRNILDFRMINVIDSELFSTKKEFHNSQFYFVLDSTGYANMIFEPDARIPNLTRRYFEKIIEEFFTPR